MIGIVAVPVVAIVVLGVEVQLARSGPDLSHGTPLDQDIMLGGGDPLLMVWLGDSTAAGVGASDGNHAMARLVAQGLHRPVQQTSLAVSGDRISDVVHDQLGTLAADQPDVVLVSIGANDVVHLTSRAAFRASYDKLIAAIPAGTLVVLLGVPDMGAPPRFAQPLRAIAGLRGRQLDGVTRAVAREHDVVYVDIAGETGPTMRSDTRRYFAADHYHPSDAGYALWAEAVLEKLRPALAVREKAG